MLTLIGGKYTTHRSLAERVVDDVVRMTGAHASRCVTAEMPVPGRREAIEALRARHAGVAGEISEAEVVHAIRTERARHLHDVLERRSRLWLDAAAMRAAVGPGSGWMGSELAWTADTRAREVDRVMSALDRERKIVEAAS